MRWLPLIALLPALHGWPARAQAPLAVQPVRGKACTALAPKGWSFTGENAAGAAFGADLMRADGAAVASYYIVGVPPEMRSSPWYGRWYATPQQAALATLSQMGTRPVQCGAPSTPAPGLTLLECRTPQLVGLALYQVFPMGTGGFVLVMRTAATAPGQWASQGALASAAARSIRCNVPLRPSSFDYTTGLSGRDKPRRKGGEADSGYSRWSGMEHYHDERTGQNYWVSPSRDWVDNGPRGPGYYIGAGNDVRKLDPGRSD